jgi:RNA polymerase sigma-70 factor (ECF subfamily)
MEQPLPDNAAIAASIATPAEFALVFHRHFDVVHGYIRKRVGGSLADDLASQTFRQERRQLRAYRRAGVETDVDPLEGIEARVDAERLRPQLAAVLAALPEDEADPLLLLAWAEVSYEEIAEALGLPIGTVKSRLSRARRRVREQLPPQRTTGDQKPIANLEVDHG